MISVVERYQLNTLFDGIIVSTYIGSRKNEPMIFECAMSKLHSIYGDCLFIDNSRSNLLVPESLGMKVYYYDDKLRDIEALRTELMSLGVQF